MNTACFLSIPAMMFPDQEIMVFDHTRLTYVQVQDRVNRLAGALRSLGLGKGSCVGVLQTNSSQYVEAYYATSKLGATFVPLNHRAKAGELKRMINTAQVDALFVGGRHIGVASSLHLELPCVKHWIAMDRKHGGMLFFEDLLASSSSYEVEEDMEGDETNLLIYTSGTTSLPKGVMLSYRDLVEYVFEIAEPADGTDRGATLLCAPLYHIAAAMSIMISVLSGRRLVLLPQFDAKEWLRLVQQERVTHAFLVPTMLKRLLEEPDLARSDLSTLEILSYGAAPMPLPVIRRAIEELPKKVGFINAFGQTETTSTVTMLLPEDHRLDGSPEEVEKKLKRLSSIGRPLPDVEIKIVAEDGQGVPRGEIGEIMVRTPRLMKGYAGQDKLVLPVLRDGWMCTRDMGCIDEGGYVFLAGRKDDLIIRGGESTAPTEIEAVLLYPGVPVPIGHRTGARTDAFGGTFRQTVFGGSRLQDLLHFLSAIYDSLEIGELRDNYLCAIHKLVGASDYGFYLLDHQGVLSDWATPSNTEDNCFGREDELCPANEPLLPSFVGTGQTGPGAVLFSDGEWRFCPSQEGPNFQLPARFLQAPVTTTSGRFVGALSFARTKWQSAFDFMDLGTIQVVAQHVGVVVSQALKYAQIRERCNLAEAVLQVIGVAVVLTDDEGTVKMSNSLADRLTGNVSPDPTFQASVNQGLRANVLQLRTPEKRVATRAIKLARRTFAGDNSLVFRSVRIPSAQGTVATFLYTSEPFRNFEHLSCILSKREMAVLELLAQGLHNREIADTLVVTTNTVKHHLKQMFHKMQVKSRTELLAKAFSSSAKEE